MKKKKLPNDFDILVESHDIEAFALFFQKHEITATNAGKSTSNAFSYNNLDSDQVQFLIDHGLNPNADCGFGLPAVAHQADNKEALECLIKNGADVNLTVVSYRGCALANACACLNVEAVENLLAANASIDIVCGIDQKTPIDSVLAHCDNIYIPKVVEICEMLLEAGAVITDKSQGYVKEIGKRFEFFRADIVPEFVPDLDKALSKLYKMFDVEPVPGREMNDAFEEIKVHSQRWQERYEELRQKLVPGVGKAKTVQGEMIRIVGKVTYEILDNGGINWDADYKKMVNALAGYLEQNEKLDGKLNGEAITIAKHINADSGKKELYRLTELVVSWVVANNVPGPLGEVDYMR